MTSTGMYYDLCGEIDLLHVRIKDLERERKHLLKMMHANAPKMPGAIDYSKEKVQSSFVVVPLNEIVERIKEIDGTVLSLHDLYRDKEQTRKKMEEKLSEYEGIDYKVAYLRMQGKSLFEISLELDYSYDWIRKVNSRIKKAHGRHKTIEKV
jgi:hypothetical protein